jgi:hypothetical protein
MPITASVIRLAEELTDALLEQCELWREGGWEWWPIVRDQAPEGFEWSAPPAPRRAVRPILVQGRIDDCWWEVRAEDPAVTGFWWEGPGVPKPLPQRSPHLLVIVQRELTERVGVTMDELHALTRAIPALEPPLREHYANDVAWHTACDEHERLWAAWRVAHPVDPHAAYERAVAQVRSLQMIQVQQRSIHPPRLRIVVALDGMPQEDRRKWRKLLKMIGDSSDDRPPHVSWINAVRNSQPQHHTPLAGTIPDAQRPHRVPQLYVGRGRTSWTRRDIMA